MQYVLTLFSGLQLFRRVAAALPGMDTNEKAKEDSTYLSRLIFPYCTISVFSRLSYFLLFVRSFFRNFLSLYSVVRLQSNLTYLLSRYNLWHLSNINDDQLTDAIFSIFHSYSVVEVDLKDSSTEAPHQEGRCSCWIFTPLLAATPYYYCLPWLLVGWLLLRSAMHS